MEKEESASLGVVVRHATVGGMCVLFIFLLGLGEGLLVGGLCADRGIVCALGTDGLWELPIALWSVEVSKQDLTPHVPWQTSPRS